MFGSPQYRCPWGILFDEDGDAVAHVIQAYLDWSLLGIIPFGASRLGELPYWVVDSFRVCSNLDQAAKIKLQVQLQGSMLSAFAPGGR